MHQWTCMGNAEQKAKGFLPEDLLEVCPVVGSKALRERDLCSHASSLDRLLTYMTPLGFVPRTRTIPLALGGMDLENPSLDVTIGVPGSTSSQSPPHARPGFLGTVTCPFDSWSPSFFT